MLHDYQKAGDMANGSVDKGLVVHVLLYCKNLVGMNIKISYADSSEFPAKCPCVFVCIYLY